MHHVQACCFHPMTARSRGYQDVHKFLHVCMRHCYCSAPIPSTPSRPSPGSTICLQHGRLIAAAFVDYLMILDIDASCVDKALRHRHDHRDELPSHRTSRPSRQASCPRRRPDNAIRHRPDVLSKAKSCFNILLNILQSPYIAIIFLQAVFSMFALQMIFRTPKQSC